MDRFTSQAAALWRHTTAEARLFWRNSEAVYMTFLIPLLGMALFVYLGREGMLDGLFRMLLPATPGGAGGPSPAPPLLFMTLGIITYCIIAAAFEGPVPKLVRERESGIFKRLGGTPLPAWVLLVAKTLSAAALIFVQVALILAVGWASSDITVAGSGWLLAFILLLGTFAVAPWGFVLSSLRISADAAVMAVHAIYIPMLLLCGAFVPVEALPGVLQAVARAFPLTYFAAPFRAVMFDGAGLPAIAGDLLVLLAWAVGGWIVAIRTFRWE
ncbi:MAG: ABC transporter permease [Anaerolineae bacterium]|nr:ABC transporter permease [Anaerolineae bacterium]